MSLHEELHRIDFERATADPAASFGSPAEVLEDRRFSELERLEVLKRWALDADLLAIAELEGMAGGEPAMLGRVLAALHELELRMGIHGGGRDR
jgi:hypothetical protein